MCVGAAICAFIVGIGHAASQGISGERIALILANGDYKQLPPLPGPLKDSVTLGNALRAAHFAVEVTPNVATLEQLKRAVKQFSEKLRAIQGDAIAILYYAGHGGVDRELGEAYAIPLNYNIDDALGVSGQSMSLTYIRDQLLLAEVPSAGVHWNKKALFIFDACRTIVLKAEAGTANKTKINGIRSDGSPIDVWQPRYRTVSPANLPSNVRPNITIAYSAEPGNVASDDGTFAEVLANEIARPGSTSTTALFETQRIVAKTTSQTPYIEFGLPEQFLFTPTAVQLMTNISDVIDAADWNSEADQAVAIAQLDSLLSDAKGLGQLKSAQLQRLVCSPGIASAPRRYLQSHGVVCTN